MPTLTVLNVGGFAQFNDTFGHAAGDRLLCDVGARLTSSRHVSVAARLGGSEFAYLTIEVPAAELVLAPSPAPTRSPAKPTTSPLTFLGRLDWPGVQHDS